MLSGDNGLLTKAQEASEKYKIEAAREKILLSILAYQADKEHTTLYDELLKTPGLTDISPNGEDKYNGPPYTVVVDGYKFIVQENEETKELEVIYIGEGSKDKKAPEIEIEYDKEKTENLYIDITAKTKDEEGLKQIIVRKKTKEGANITYEEIPVENGGKLEGQEAKIKVQIPANGEYEIQVIGKNDKIARKEITIDNIVNATIMASISAGTVIDNHVVLTITVTSTVFPIKDVETYIDGQKIELSQNYTTNEEMKKVATYTLNNMEFYKNISCYVKAKNTKDKETISTTINVTNKNSIATAIDLKNLAIQVNNNANTFEKQTVKVIKDINLNGSNTNLWTPIGNSINKFKGTFLGNKYIINQLYINNNANYQGLFGYLEGATIQEVIISDTSKTSSITGHNYVGAIAGYCKNSTIQNCANYAYVYGNNSFSGIIGSSENSTITGCANYGDLGDIGSTTPIRIGGIVGYLVNSTVCYSYNKGTIAGGYAIGGIVGNANNHGKVYNCYNQGNVFSCGCDTQSNSARSGGIVGVLRYYSEIKYCYNSENVMSSATIAKHVGGICGIASAADDANIFKKEYATKIWYCYNSGNVSSKGNQVGGICGSNNQYSYLTNCFISGGATVIGKGGKAEARRGLENNGYVGTVVGYSYDINLPYCGDFGDITTQTVYYVVNGQSDGNSSYWSNTSKDTPKLLWERF